MSTPLKSSLDFQDLSIYEATIANNPDRKKLTCLLAEDNKAYQLVMGRILKQIGIQCVTVGNRDLALKKLRSCTFDFAIFDNQMPENTGPQAAKEWRTEEGSKKLPIIA